MQTSVGEPRRAHAGACGGRLSQELEPANVVASRFASGLPSKKHDVSRTRKAVHLDGLNEFAVVAGDRLGDVSRVAFLERLQPRKSNT